MLLRLVTTTALVGLSAGALAVPTFAQEMDQVTFQFSWLPGGDRAAFYLAQSEGLFAAENLEVELLGGRGSSDAITRVATGAADMGEGGLDALFHAKLEGDVPVVAVMPLYTSAPDGLITTAQSGISTLEDVAGRSVATSPFTSSNGPWPFLLEMNGVSIDDVDMTQADAAALPAMLATGQVDAIIQYVTNAPSTGEILEEAGQEPVIIPWADYGLEGYSASIFVSESYLAENRDVVVRFTRALMEAEQMMQEDPERAAAAVVSAIPEMEMETTLTVTQATLPLIFNANTDTAGLGVYDPERVQTTWEWVAQQAGIAADALDPMTVVYLDIAAER